MREAWLTTRTLSWAGYDVASSVYIGVAPAVLLPIYFQELMVGFQSPSAAWGGLSSLAILASSIAALAAALLARHFGRLGLLTIFTAGLVLALVALAMNPYSWLLQAVLAYVAAQSFYFAATTIYESYLPDLLPASERQALSGFGWAAGYLGGIFAILVLILLIRGQSASPSLLQACFGALALISALLFALVITAMRRTGFGLMGTTPQSLAWRDISSAFRNWQGRRSVLLLLAGTMLVQAAVSVVVTFTAPILANRFGQDLHDLLWLLLLIHLLAVPSTYGWSRLMSGRARVGPMSILLAAWGVVLLLLAFGNGPWMPFATVSVIGCCLGATASALRGFLAESLAPGRSVSYFAFATVAGRLAAALGPALFAVCTLLEGERAGLLFMLVVLACGSGLIMLHLLEPAARGGAASPAE